MQPGGDFLTVSCKGPVLRISPVATVGQKLTVLGEQNEKEAIEQCKTVAATCGKVASGVLSVCRSGQKTFDAQAKGIKYPLLEPFTHANAVLGTAFPGTHDQR